jgi:outer membrane receptor protein involved in Fe transport
LNLNNGGIDDDLISLKASAIYRLNPKWELYVSAGQGFHSNDGRGTTITVDPSDNSQIDAVDPLVPSLGYEVGVRGFMTEKLNASMALWALDLDGELLFVGDAGNTEANRASVRQGIEIATYYSINETWSLDFEYAFSDARFEQDLGEGDNIPGAIEHVLQTGLNIEMDNGWFGSLRFRYFGERPLTEDGSVESDSSAIWNLRLGYQQENWVFKADVLNLTDSDDHDVDYYYQSRLPSEAAGLGTKDIHAHVFEPRTLRLSLGYQF